MIDDKELEIEHIEYLSELAQSLEMKSKQIFNETQKCIEKYNKKYPESINNTEKYTIEPHGVTGQYALYKGRDTIHHGARLCNINDFDMNEKQTIKMIVNALNKQEE